MRTPFTGCGTALVTPFTSSGAVDEAAVRRQEENLRLMFGPMTDFVRPGILVGTPTEVTDRIGAYERAGAEWVIVAFRAPFDWAGLELFVREVMPAFR